MNEIYFNENKNSVNLNETISTERKMFGYEITKQIDKVDNRDKGKNVQSFVPKNEEDDIATISAGGYFGQYYDIYGDQGATSKDLILKYRAAAEQPEVDRAIQDIVDESVASLEQGDPVYLVMDDLDYSENVKGRIETEFKTILKLLRFSENGADIFRHWYVDGRLYYHILIDSSKPKEGIQELRMIDPINIRKAQEVETKIDQMTGAKITEVKKEFYIYNDSSYPNSGGSFLGGVEQTSSLTTNQGLRVEKDAVVRITSGIMDTTRTRTLSHLHKALRIVNQLRMLEDALVIYRLSRAPERRIFYIDVGNLPKSKAEEYVHKTMSKYRNKIVYDSETGNVKNDKKHMNMMEDFWLPRREGGRGTEIDTLPGGENLGQIDDIIFFQKKLYKSLNIPETRLEPEEMFTTGRATEINRDEVKFQKFVNRLRRKFSYLFLDLLKTQLQLKGIVEEKDWEDIVQNLKIDFVQDNHFYELKNYEIIRDRLDILRDLEQYVGTYYSREWVRQNLLQLSEDESEEIKKQIEEEKKSGEISEEDSGRGW